MNPFKHRFIEPLLYAEGMLLAVLVATPAIRAQDAPAPPSGGTHRVLPGHAKPGDSGPKSAAAPAAAILPPSPPTPHWPANEKPHPASITWDAHGLRIEATNASLQQILKEVSTLTGAKVEGLGSDERVFGAYGPGLARDVVSQLLQGSNYNVLMIGDQGQGAPRQIVLSSRNTSPVPIDQSAGDENNGDDDTDVDVDDQTQPQPPQPPGRPNFGPGGPPHTPQQMLLEMQQRQQELQRQQQMNQQQPQ